MLSKAEVIHGLAMYHDAIKDSLGGGGGKTYNDFTGATSVAGGLSGLVPAPSAGDESKFLRGDGTWASVLSGATYDDFTGATSIAGGLSGLVPAPAAGDANKSLRGNGTWSNDIVLPTTENLVNGGFWLDVSGDVPVPKFYYGGETYVFDGANKAPRLPDDIVAYLPFSSSPTIDFCGNTWTAVGTPTIVDDANVPSGKSLYLNGDSYLDNTTVSDSVGASPWTIDFWLNGRDDTNSKLFGTFNNVYATHENCTTTNEKNFCIMLSRCGARPSYELDMFYNGTEFANVSTPVGTRHHHALTYDGTDIRFFLDGVLIGSFTQNVILGRRFRIGDATFNNTGTHFQGSFDHFRIFKTALWTSDFTPPYLESDYYV